MQLHPPACRHLGPSCALAAAFHRRRNTPRQQQCISAAAQAAAAAAAAAAAPSPQQEQLPWWPSAAAKLRALRLCVQRLLEQQQQAAHHQHDDLLLEALSEVEVCRSNLLRPAGYFADAAAAAAPSEHAAVLAQLQAAAAEATTPVYACLPLLLALVQAAGQAVGQLVEAAGSEGAPDAPSRCVRLPGSGLLVEPASARGAAVLAAEARNTAEAAVQQAAGNETSSHDAAALACRAAVRACRQALRAADAALASTLPAADSDAHWRADAGLLQQLLVCRHLLAAWLPPLAAQAAYVAAAAAATPSSNGGLTTRQQLQHALASLAAVSSSSSRCAAPAPLMLLTTQQAAVLQPLLNQGGLSTACCAPLGLSGCGPSLHAAGAEQAQPGAAHWPGVSEGPDGQLLLASSTPLQVHPGEAGRVHLSGLLAVTEQAHALLLQAGQDGQQAGLLDQGLAIPVALQPQLALLRVSTDVQQLLLTHHPSPGVRQQMYVDGLLPQLHLQQQVLDAVLDLRARLAAELAADSYLQLVLCSGSCLGGAPAAHALVEQLLPHAQQHAAAEWRELQGLAAHRQRAAGRAHSSSSLRSQQPGGDAVAPWDVAFASVELVKQLSGLDWARDLAPYFTLPGVLGRLDVLLADLFGLRLLPATEAAAAESGATERGELSVPCSIQPWGPHVLHFIVLTPAEEQQLEEGLCVAGHIFLELVSSTSGFPTCSLLQLPVPAQPSNVREAQQLVIPGAVVLRVPVPAASQQQQPASTPGVQPAVVLPGPEALQALLHELGHALSYLAPSAKLMLPPQQHGGQQQEQHSSSSSSPSWAACLLAGPSAGLDVRETSSHLFECFARTPASLLALSSHERLGVPLPQHTALQMARMMAAPAGLSSGRLARSLQDALHDIAQHSGSINSSSSSGVQDPQALPLLDDVGALAAAGPVGGAKAGYVLARLLAAAAWKCSGADACLSGLSRSEQQHTRQRLRRLADVLLSSGGSLPSHHTAARMLLLDPGAQQASAASSSHDEAAVLEPVWGDSGAASPSSSGARPRIITGWLPNLYHEVYQDIEL